MNHKHYHMNEAQEVLKANLKKTSYSCDWNGEGLCAPLKRSFMLEILRYHGFGEPEAECIVAALVMSGAHFWNE